jgi:CheY-like chemotaxis protein
MPGRGAVFTVTLPLALHSPGEQAGPAEIVGAAKSRETSVLTPHSILVVEDEPSIRELVRDTLTARGMEVECAGSGQEAVERAAARRYTLIICDLKMPGMGGAEVFHHLKSRPDGSPQPFLFMTGDLAEAETLDFLRDTKARAIHKPFKISDLIAAMKEALEPAPPNPEASGREAETKVG